MHDSFIKGSTYRVLRNFSKFSRNFTEGQKLRLINEFYSHYHGLKIYAFESLGTGEQVSLEITDDENVSAWRVFFEEIEE
jgi:hypothetical protein